MRVVSYTIVHYGKDYIDWALRSVQNSVHHSNVIHTPHPSHGHRTNIQPIESLQDIQSAVSVKAVWYQTDGIYEEGRQRDHCVRLCAVQDEADLILVLDYDEVWPEQTLKAALDYVWQQDKARNWLINFTHLWKSFNYVCRDEGRPVRIIDLRHRDGIGYIPKELGEIYHFGYAVSDRVMRYKWQIHGHKSELRANWMQDKWLAWPPVDDCHPTNDRGFWTPEPFDRTRLPKLMRNHPYYNLEVIP